jgi:hypothetical protein
MYNTNNNDGKQNQTMVMEAMTKQAKPSHDDTNNDDGKQTKY